MKKLVFALALFTSFSSLSFAVKPQLPIVAFEPAPSENNTVLQKWFTDNHIAGKTVSTEKEARNLPNFPEQFVKFRIRVIKDNSPVTMDFSLERLNFTLDKDGKIVKTFIG